MIGKKFDFKPYKKGGEKFDKILWDECEKVIDEMRLISLDEWVAEEYKLITRKKRKEIKKKQIQLDDIKKLARLRVLKGFKDKRSGMIALAYKTAIIQRNGRGSAEVDKMVQEKLRNRGIFLEPEE
tara:strand:- start:510 stop:887 length:378 start_codon:yes stop_codon:yes gene_type:complete